MSRSLSIQKGSIKDWKVQERDTKRLCRKILKTCSSEFTHHFWASTSLEWTKVFGNESMVFLKKGLRIPWIVSPKELFLRPPRTENSETKGWHSETKKKNTAKVVGRRPKHDFGRLCKCLPICVRESLVYKFSDWWPWTFGNVAKRSQKHGPKTHRFLPSQIPSQTGQLLPIILGQLGHQHQQQQQQEAFPPKRASIPATWAQGKPGKKFDKLKTQTKNIQTRLKLQKGDFKNEQKGGCGTHYKKNKVRDDYCTNYYKLFQTRVNHNMSRSPSQLDCWGHPYPQQGEKKQKSLSLPKSF